MTRVRALPLMIILALGLGGLGAAPLAAETYQIDPVHSSVLFVAKHFGVSNFYGRFNEIAGTIEYDEAKPEAGKVELTIQTESVDTHNERRDGHLKSPDFFNAKQFPTITFESTKIVSKGDDRFEVTGELTLLGQTREVTLEVERTGTGKHPRSGAALIGFETRTSIKRSDFGMSFMVGPLSDEIDLIIAIEAAAQ